MVVETPAILALVSRDGPMIHRFMYSSVAIMALDDAELDVLLGTSRRNNERDGLTGILLHVTSLDSTQAAFVQVLEGGRDAIRRTYARIEKDDLHTDLRVLWDGPRRERVFSDWTMRLEQVSATRLHAVGTRGEPGDAVDMRTLIRDVPSMEAVVAEFADSTS